MIARDLHETFLRHADGLRSLARRLLADDHAAEDVVQDTWVVALTRPPAHAASPGGWLRTVARSLALRRRRTDARRGLREGLGARPESVAPTSAAAEEAEERARALRLVTEAVLSLETPYRDVLLLRFFEALPPRQIARREGAPLATVKSRLARALRQLRERLGPDADAWRRSLALLVGLPPSFLPPVPTDGAGVPQALDGAQRAAEAAASKTSLLAIAMTVKLKLVAGVAATALLAVALGRSTDSPMLGARPDAPAAPGLAPAPPASLAALDALPTPAAAKERQAVASESVPSGRSWPASLTAPLPHVFELGGVVVDPRDLPVAGAQIYAGPLGHGLNKIGTTAPDGTFRFTWRGYRANMELALSVAAPGGVPAGMRRLRIQSGTPHAVRLPVPQATGRIRLNQNTGSLTLALDLGPATSADGSSFAYVARGTPRDAIPTALIDEEGFTHFVSRDLSGVCPVNRGSGVTGAGNILRGVLFAEFGAAFEGLDLADYEVLVEVTEQARVRVEGIVRAPDGQPVADTTVVRLRDDGRVCEQTTTAADGSFLFTDLPVGEVHLRAGGGTRGLAQISYDAAAGNVLHWEPLLDRGRELRGRLVDEQGAPLAHWNVVAQGLDALLGWNDATRTDARGRFAIPNAPHVGVRILAAPDEAAFPLVVVAEFWPLELPYPEAHELRAGTVATNVGLIEVPDAARSLGALALVVHDAEGRPHAAAQVRLWHAASGTGITLERDEEEPGRFLAARLPAGRYTLELGAAGHGWRTVEALWIAADTEHDLGPVSLPAPSIVALELDRGGREAGPGLALELWREHADVLTRQRLLAPPSDEVGPAALLLPAGEYLLLVGGQAVGGTLPLRLPPGAARRLRVDLGGRELSGSESALGAAELAALRAAFAGGAGECGACHTSVAAR